MNNKLEEQPKPRFLISSYMKPLNTIPTVLVIIYISILLSSPGNLKLSQKVRASISLIDLKDFGKQH
jgi:hypothetical protein